MNSSWNWRKGERIELAPQSDTSTELKDLQKELRRQKRAMRDLVALSIMPAAWVGRGPAHILKGLLELLFSTLRLDAAYVCVDAIAGDQACDLVQAAEWPEFSAWVEENKSKLRPLRKVDRIAPPILLDVGEPGYALRLQVAGIGMQTSMGIVVVGSCRPDFPTEEEKLLLSVAANQASIAFQAAQLNAERDSVTRALLQSERLASVGRLAATIAHEINNPLEAVINFIYLAKSNRDLPEKVRRQLTLADQELARVSHIAQQTLGFYRDNSRPAYVNIGDMIEDVLAIYERKFTYKSLTVERRIDKDLKLLTLQGEIKQVLSNLITNAIDASSDGGKLLVSAKRSYFNRSEKGQGVRITVADTGTGMSPGTRVKIFTPFFTTKQDVGTGLGLWVSKSIMEKHHGLLQFRSRQGKNSGTAMSILLPLTAERDLR
jgi:nitrogen-specific signal transduction histidine kinase